MQNPTPFYQISKRAKKSALFYSGTSLIKKKNFLRGDVYCIVFCN
jgi:hypothetical protein